MPDLCNHYNNFFRIRSLCILLEVSESSPLRVLGLANDARSYIVTASLCYLLNRTDWIKGCKGRCVTFCINGYLRVASCAATYEIGGQICCISTDWLLSIGIAYNVRQRSIFFFNDFAPSFQSPLLSSYPVNAGYEVRKNGYLANE